MNASEAIQKIRAKYGLTQEKLARLLGVSFVSVNRWERGSSAPSPAQSKKIFDLLEQGVRDQHLMTPEAEFGVFASHGARNHSAGHLFEEPVHDVSFSHEPLMPLFQRIKNSSDSPFATDINAFLSNDAAPAKVKDEPPLSGLSAGKNTYAYDAHTYHTKVPPQGIAEILNHYLPEKGVVLDPFAGSGMTGVAAAVTGNDVILNELSPAACFIESQFLSKVDPLAFQRAVEKVMEETQELRRELYSTCCRECGRTTEARYFVWSYRVACPHCETKFVLWDHCRSYGSRVKEHKILKEFPCPVCSVTLKKSRLKRFDAVPVQVGYKCCGSRQQEVTHPLNEEDLAKIEILQNGLHVAEDFAPDLDLPDGDNLNQPKNHGLTSIRSFYTPRNFAALTNIWRNIHRVDDVRLAGALGFAFTSLYQRVSRLSEFRFWGGSGNTPRFNVPYIFNEANVFLSFERKAKSIQDYYGTTGQHLNGKVAIRNGSATDMSWLPSKSIDLIFTDPPFGGFINYSEMNILWESWLGEFTNPKDEAIINKHQEKDLSAYGDLLFKSLCECRRVLKENGWLILVFMNSSAGVWDSLRRSIAEAGFDIAQTDIFDKQHGTFKHHVSDNTAGCDLVLHCRPVEGAKRPSGDWEDETDNDIKSSVEKFISDLSLDKYKTVYLHVSREDDLDYRLLYSEWLASSITSGGGSVGFPEFRAILNSLIYKS